MLRWSIIKLLPLTEMHICIVSMLIFYPWPRTFFFFSSLLCQKSLGLFLNFIIRWCAFFVNKVVWVAKPALACRFSMRTQVSALCYATWPNPWKSKLSLPGLIYSLTLRHFCKRLLRHNYLCRRLVLVRHFQIMLFQVLQCLITFTSTDVRFTVL